MDLFIFYFTLSGNACNFDLENNHLCTCEVNIYNKESRYCFTGVVSCLFLTKNFLEDELCNRLM